MELNLKGYKFLLVPVIIVLAGLLSLVLILPGQIRSVSEDFRQVDLENKKIIELKTKYALVSSLDKNLLVKQASLTATALAEEKNIPFILQGARNAINDSGFAIQELKFAPGEIKKEEGTSEESSAKRIEELPLQLTIVGPVDKMVDLFTELENTLPIFSFRDFSISAAGKQSTNGRAEIKLNTFYSPPLASSKKEVTLQDLILTEKEILLLDQLSQYDLTTVGGGLGGNAGQLMDENRNPFSF